MTLVPGRIADLGNDRDQRFLCVEAVKNIDWAEIETEMSQLCQQANRTTDGQPGFLLNTILHGLEHGKAWVAEVVGAAKRCYSEFPVTQHQT